MPNQSAKSRKSDLADHLRRAILTTTLSPGADLDEAELCAQFNLSRTPLREVFRELAGEGYVDLREMRGARVAELSHTTLRDFFLAAPMIYGAILRLAALNATDIQVARLKKAQAGFRETLQGQDVGARALANNHFHEITGEMAANRYLMPSFRRLLIDHARISMTFYRPRNTEMADNLTQAADQHDAIIKAIAKGNAAKAEKLAVEHWNLSRDQIEMFVMPDALDLTLATARPAAPA